MTEAEFKALQERAAKGDKGKPARFWCVLKIADYKLQCLGYDPAGDDEDDVCLMALSHRIVISGDREAMFQAGRSCQGLLVSVESLPTIEQLQAVQAAILRVKDEPALDDDTESPTGEDKGPF